MRLPGIFRSDKIYKVSIAVEVAVGTGIVIQSYNPSTNQTDAILPNPLNGVGLLNGYNNNYTPPSGYTDFVLAGSAGNGEINCVIKHISITFDEPVQVSDSDMKWAGRRTSYYRGTKISSLDVNVDSNETVDGGPVVVINTVNSNTPTAASMPLATATERSVDPGRAIINRTSYQGVAPYVQTMTERAMDPARALANRSSEGRALVNIAGQPIVQSSDRMGRALVNYGGQPIVVSDARRLVNRSNS